MRILPAGAGAVLVEVDDQATALAWHAAISRRRAQGWAPGLVDVVPGARTVLLDGVDDPRGLAAELAGWELPAAAPPAGPVVEVPSTYDGEDLAEVAAGRGMSAAEAAQQHRETTFEVAFCGFSPGFAYLVGLPEELAVPRRPVPRTAVPAGSIALAGTYTGVYPRRSPGGWLLIGHTDAVLWDAGRDPAALLAPGTRVRFVPARPSPSPGNGTGR